MLREKGQDSHHRFPCGKKKPALLSGRDAQALNYLKVYADETANAVEEAISHNPQPALPLGKPTKDDVLQCYSTYLGQGVDVL